MRFSHPPFALATIVFLLAGSVVAACSSEPKPANAANPLEALRAETQTDRYRQAFWEDAVDNKPELFRKALAFCKSHDFNSTTYPNCEFVRGPAMLYNMNQQPDSIEAESFDGSWDLGQGGGSSQGSSGQ